MSLFENCFHNPIPRSKVPPIMCKIYDFVIGKRNYSCGVRINTKAPQIFLLLLTRAVAEVWRIVFFLGLCEAKIYSLTLCQESFETYFNNIAAATGAAVCILERTRRIRRRKEKEII
jgi:hypothetical protein